MTTQLVGNLIRVYVASRKQESSTLRSIVRLLGWTIVALLTWWQGVVDAEQIVLVIAGSESFAALIGAFFPDKLARHDRQNPIPSDTDSHSHAVSDVETPNNNGFNG